jgi:hypothetical protein
MSFSLGNIKHNLIQIKKVAEDTKAPFSNFAAERINDVNMVENLADANALNRPAADTP